MEWRKRVRRCLRWPIEANQPTCLDSALLLLLFPYVIIARLSSKTFVYAC